MKEDSFVFLFLCFKIYLDKFYLYIEGKIYIYFDKLISFFLGFYLFWVKFVLILCRWGKCVYVLGFMLNEKVRYVLVFIIGIVRFEIER